MTEHRQAHDQILAFVIHAPCGKCVHAVECVNPHIALRMPLRVLGTVDECAEFREEPHPLAIPKKGKPS